MILVTGASGNLGKAVVENLLQKIPANQITGFVRDKSKAEYLTAQGVTVVEGEYDNIESLDRAMVGVEKVLLISGMSMDRLTQHKNVIDAAKRAGVRQIAYTSVSLQDVENSPIRSLMGSHFQTEDYLKQSGVPFTILRNSLYFEVIPMYIGEQAQETGIFYPAGTGQAPFVSRHELAEAAAIVLTNEQHFNQIYELTNSELYSFGDIAQLLSSLSGKTIPYVDADPEAFENQLKQLNLPDFIVHISSSFAKSIKNGDYAKTYADLEKLLGRAPAPLTTYLKSYYIDGKR